MKQQITLRLPQELIKELEELAKELSISKHVIINIMLKSMLSNKEEFKRRLIGD